ncbi:DUF805 domain-containing protein [Phenylobacterium sp.]|uniref:DUF805 domain-containing protein n=1 Tax=Phenylobacterium sp. TaxID=1871053 RepID=UPI00120A10E7|nr:MAG: DUF805 domain-containing protein [Phenylobacterium sp.]
MRTTLLRYISFKGRASRVEFALLAFAAVTAWTCSVLTFQHWSPPGWNALLSLPLIALPYLLVPSAGVRRLHDLNWSGRVLVLGLNPITGPLLVLWLAVQPGVTGASRCDLPFEAEAP